jgi:hypothetical protein
MVNNLSIFKSFNSSIHLRKVKTNIHKQRVTVEKTRTYLRRSWGQTSEAREIKEVTPFKVNPRTNKDKQIVTMLVISSTFNIVEHWEWGFPLELMIPPRTYRLGSVVATHPDRIREPWVQFTVHHFFSSPIVP